MAAIVLDNERHKRLQRERNTWSLVRACFAAYMHGEKPTADKPGSATTDLAVLFPDGPGKHVRDFLGHIGIKTLWFTGDKIVDASDSILFT